MTNKGDDSPARVRLHLWPSYDSLRMTIRVNGRMMAVEPPCTVRRLLERLDLRGGPCAVEVNTRVVPGREHERHELADGDVVEIVTLVGGG